MSTTLPPWLNSSLPPPEEIHRRLQALVPPSLDPRNFVRRLLAAKTIFVFLYGYAIEGEERWLRPTAVTDMTDEQAAKLDRAARERWLENAQGRKRPRDVPGRWFGENTRESIRDETIRRLVELGIVVERSGLPTTSPKPRYALARDFLPLCDPGVEGDALARLLEAWRRKHLGKASLARLALVRKGAAGGAESVLVNLPNGEVRRLAPGSSSRLSKAVAERFGPLFLITPAVVLLSESAEKVSYRDEELLELIGLRIDPQVSLPDLVLADLGSDPPLLVFVECVISDGAIDDRRRGQLLEIALSSGYRPHDCAFVTAYHDRVGSPFRTTAASLAWGTFVWFETEPDKLVLFHDGSEKRVKQLAAWLGLGS